jgi:Flagellar biosynthesis/type III secretory pathway lipoprotein
VNNFLETIRNLGLPLIALLTGVSVGLLIFLIYISTRLTTADMALLFDDLQTADAAAITEQLDATASPIR